ncbi:MAG: hypothetical protein VR68_01260 [Peptococcaceae bacterium BRH_c4a]|nr:MAG: hypothetical protein VR68_01260 [Peptococcaceae bacterium BRH_c4a]
MIKVIRTDKEFTAMKERLLQDEKLIKIQREELTKMGLTEEQIDRVIEPTICFYEQLKEEVSYYERIKRGEFDALENFLGLGKILIGARIALGLSQCDLANRLGVSEAQVSKDERNEYHGITVEKAQRILDALGIKLISTVQPFPKKLAS